MASCSAYELGGAGWGAAIAAQGLAGRQSAGGWGLGNLPVNLCQCLFILTVKEVFPDVQAALPVFQVVPIASCPLTGHYWKEPGSVLFKSSLQVFIHMHKIPLSLLFCMLNSPSSLSLSS
ncbi:hypothetical protein QYF61_008090 [Mycteria americana]|uniref:Uncharacterized protein n=1 Tax=Mycteria americana TaxID=33587 RepID=A0AAN7NT05_MYCAM|nr:hypothetical protein QYF61_008090 [Mycteria americana]